MSALSRRIVRNPKVDPVTGLRVVHVSRLWKAANDKHCGKALFSKAALARFMRSQAVNVTPSGTVWRCRYCAMVLAGEQLSLDHMTPVAAGGPNTLDNLALCCAECNKLKEGMTAEGCAKVLQLLKELDSISRTSLMRRLNTRPGWKGSKPQHVVRVVTRRGPRG